MSKPIVAFDGEGQGAKYILLADSDGQEIHLRRGLKPRACLEFLTRPALKSSLNIWYSFGYDVNMLLCGVADLDFWMARRPLNLSGYEIRYTPSKILKIRYAGQTYTHYDVFGFFQTSFRKAIEKWLGVTDEVIEAGKLARGNFAEWEMKRIIEYNARELTYLKQLGEKLTTMFATLDIPLRMKSWHGAGAAAQAALATIKLDQELPCDPRVEEMAQVAYYGGRVETLRRGTFQNVFHADLKSAYPSACLNLPSLSKTTWHETTRIGKKPGLYEIDFATRWGDRLGPLPVRLSSGLITFPLSGSGTYWGVEVRAALRQGAVVTVKRGLAVDQFVLSDLAGLVTELYRLRTVYQRAGDGREKAVKLCLNALYGKLAQKTQGRYYSLALAGLITAMTRAKLFEAACQKPDDVIALATDGIYSTAELSLDVGQGLGQWEVEACPELRIIMNGVYLLTNAQGKIESKTRGFNLPQEEFERVYRDVCDFGRSDFEAQRFVTHSLHLLQPQAYPRACEWVRTVRKITPAHDIKRCWPAFFDGSAQSSAPLPGPYASTPYHPRLEEGSEMLFLDFDDL